MQTPGRPGMEGTMLTVKPDGTFSVRTEPGLEGSAKLHLLNNLFEVDRTWPKYVPSMGANGQLVWRQRSGDGNNYR
jgi:hypothetical protein